MPIATGERLCSKYEFARVLALGAELNMDMVLANPWDGDRLHLEMTPDPYDTHLHRHFAGG